MGDYAPEDQRAVHNDNDATWREQEEGAQDDSARAQPGYGNARNAEGQMDQDVATSSLGDRPLAQGSKASAIAQPGEISSRPDERAAADADRPLGES
ncbi:hypothetical protein [Qipengyuania vesicularis]|uniref:hypothetical protein n=1 Tax=Qipengyuania vesicularis TaxID=2867232 RepID=UPI001C879A2C|nr:hypothetical protein [Qipengyuania vesicularis]MBX7528029.1 hypothetical protein [Qipengyuania vesicularis]